MGILNKLFGSNSFEKLEADFTVMMKSFLEIDLYTTDKGRGDFIQLYKNGLSAEDIFVLYFIHRVISDLTEFKAGKISDEYFLHLNKIGANLGKSILTNIPMSKQFRTELEKVLVDVISNKNVESTGNFLIDTGSAPFVVWDKQSHEHKLGISQ